MPSSPTSDDSAKEEKPNLRVSVTNSAAHHSTHNTLSKTLPNSQPTSSVVHLPSPLPFPATTDLTLPQEFNNVFDHDYFNAFPPGYRFNPTDQELVLHYLTPKVVNQPLPRHRIAEVNLYQHNPDVIAELFRNCGEGEWYFFTPRNRKYKKGSRPNRAAGEGFWRATGVDKSVKSRGVEIGFRKALVFHLGKAPKGTKTNWIMHEFRLSEPPQRIRNGPDDMKLDDWVLCRIYKKSENPNSRNRRNRRGQDQDPDQDQDCSDLTMNHQDGSTGMGNAGMEFSHGGQIVGDYVCGSSFQEQGPVSSFPSFNADRPYFSTHQLDCSSYQRMPNYNPYPSYDHSLLEDQWVFSQDDAPSHLSSLNIPPPNLLFPNDPSAVLPQLSQYTASTSSLPPQVPRNNADAAGGTPPMSQYDVPSHLSSLNIPPPNHQVLFPNDPSAVLPRLSQYTASTSSLPPQVPRNNADAAGGTPPMSQDDAPSHLSSLNIPPPNHQVLFPNDPSAVLPQLSQYTASTSSLPPWVPRNNADAAGGTPPMSK